MIVGTPDGMTRVECKSCGFSNLVPEKEVETAPSGPGSYSFAPRASPTCARCLKTLS